MNQLSLPLNFPEISHDQPLLPVRMVNEFVYCARLAYLEWVQGEWRESLDTVQGTHAHRRVDQAHGNLPVLDPQTVLEMPEKILHARSVELSSARLGLIGKLDESTRSYGQCVDFNTGFARADDAQYSSHVDDVRRLVLRPHDWPWA